MLDAAALGIACSIVQPGQAGEGDRRRAHRTGLQRHMQRTIRQPRFAAGGTGGADCQHFRMRRRVAELLRAIAGAGQHPALRIHNHRAHRHLAPGRGGARFLQRQRHGC